MFFIFSDEVSTVAVYFYPLAHEEARGYRVCSVCKYVRNVPTYLCSPFVIALAPTFIDGFNITSHKYCI